MRQVVFAFLFISVSFYSFSQEGLTIGLMGGTSHYLGDYNKTNPFYAPSLGYGFILKNDYSKRYSLKVMVARETLRGNVNDFDDFVYPSNPGNLRTKNSFRTQFWDVSATMEFNFLPYDVFNFRKENFTPFVFMGLGTDFFLTNENFNFPLTIPFGLGIKYNIFERFSIGFEWNARKVFFDSMDGVNTINGNISKIHNDDWYHMGFFFITYKPFARDIECPTYDD